MVDEPLHEDRSLFLLAAPSRTVAAREREHFGVVLSGAVADPLEVAIEVVDSPDRVARRLDRLEAEDAAEESAVGVLLAVRRRVEVEVAAQQASALKDACDVARLRADLGGDPLDLGHPCAIELENLALLRRPRLGARVGEKWHLLFENLLLNHRSYS